MYVWMYVCMNVCMYVCIYVNLPVLQLEFMAGVLGGNNLVLTHMFLVDTHHLSMGGIQFQI